MPELKFGYRACYARRRSELQYEIRHKVEPGAVPASQGGSGTETICIYQSIESGLSGGKPVSAVIRSRRYGRVRGTLSLRCSSGAPHRNELLLVSRGMRRYRGAQSILAYQ